MSEFEAVIGLEIHVQLNTLSKIWCSCEVTSMADENSRVCEVCSGQPGTLPVLNKKVVDFAIMTGKALHCRINTLSFFDRKNYFYPDLPKGYQITQYKVPLAEEGHLIIKGENGEDKKIGIERVQIEEDTGKSMHEGPSSLVNLNRCGTALLEIVGRPHLASAKEASQYFKKLHSILTYMDVTRGNLQEGNMRCDVNLSLRPRGSQVLGTRTEVKNLNSFRNVERAIEEETRRQTETLKAGKKVIQQTLAFDMSTGSISVLREKSDVHDYRYFEEPDLLPISLEGAYIDRIAGTITELPDEKKARLVKGYALPEYDAEVLTSSKELAGYFEEAVREFKGGAKKVSNWIMVELLKLINEAGVSIQKSPVSPVELARMLNLVDEGRISGKMAKEVFQEMFDRKIGALEAVSKLGLSQISDESELEEALALVLKKNPVQLKQYLEGKEKLFGFFVGQAMKETKGQGHPEKINQILKRLLDKEKKG